MRQPSAAYPEYKPKGLWYSVGRAWEEWCNSESFHLGALQYDVTLDLSRILILASVRAILDFNERFKVEAINGLVTGIDWRKVARAFDGIEIAPYQRELRYSEATRWYYGWDVASGCVWHRRAILSVAAHPRTGRTP